MRNHICWFVAIARALYANRWSRYVLTVALVGLVVVKVDLRHVWRALGSARPEYLLLALCLTPLFIYFKVLRWHFMLRAASIDATFKESAVSLVGGMGLALVTPARLGELIRVAYLRDEQKMKIGGLVLIDKGFDVLVLVILSIPGAWRLLGPPAGVLMSVVALTGLTLVFLPRFTARFLAKLSVNMPFRGRLQSGLGSLDCLTPLNTGLFLTLTLLAFAVILLQFGVILLSWRSWSLDVVLLSFPLVILTNIVPLTVGGLGIREGVAAALLSHFGVPAAYGALTAFISFTINTALPGFIGAFLLPVANRSTSPPPIPVTDQT
jgi:glycosyltransferase 2 family protein